MLLKFYIMELFESRADDYPDELSQLKPVKDGTEKLPKRTEKEVEEDTVYSASEVDETTVFSVTG